jgi:hypothetical protein
LFYPSHFKKSNPYRLSGFTAGFRALLRSGEKEAELTLQAEIVNGKPVKTARLYKINEPDRCLAVFELGPENDDGWNISDQLLAEIS